MVLASEEPPAGSPNKDAPRAGGSPEGDMSESLAKPQGVGARTPLPGRGASDRAGSTHTPTEGSANGVNGGSVSTLSGTSSNNTEKEALKKPAGRVGSDPEVVEMSRVGSGRSASPENKSSPASAAKPPTKRAVRELLETRNTSSKMEIGQGVLLTADISGAELVIIRGQFEGKVKAQCVDIEQGAEVKGTVECEAARIDGKFDGVFMSVHSLHRAVWMIDAHLDASSRLLEFDKEGEGGAVGGGGGGGGGGGCGGGSRPSSIANPSRSAVIGIRYRTARPLSNIGDAVRRVGVEAGMQAVGGGGGGGRAGRREGRGGGRGAGGGGGMATVYVGDA
eukprot:jgi/Undpi1/12660/HiC_scaffold_6.g02328.m1